MAKQPAKPAAAPRPAAGDCVEATSGEHALVVAAGEGEVGVYSGDDGEATAGVQLWAIDHVRVRARVQQERIDRLRGLLTRGARDGEPEGASDGGA